MSYAEHKNYKIKLKKTDIPKLAVKVKVIIMSILLRYMWLLAAKTKK